MQFEAKTVSIDSIDIEDTSFKISTPKQIDDLAHSIERTGLLTPPIIKALHNGYIIISGFHRLYACKKIGWKNIESRIISPDVKDVDCLKVAILDNAYNRQMNLIEKSIVLTKLASFYSAEDEFITNVNEIGFGDNLNYIKKLLKLTTLIPELQHGILSGVTPMTIALEIGTYDKESMFPILRLFEGLHPTLNQQKEILTLIRETSKIRNSSIENIVKDQQILDIMNNPDFSRVQKIKELRVCLHKMRYPHISRHYDRFNVLTHRLKLPEKIKLIPPENFEDIGFSMSMKFDSLQEFESCLKVLTSLSDSLEFKTIISNDSAA